MNRDTVLELYRKMLKHNFNKFSLEAVEAADNVTRYYDPTKGPLENYARRALNNRIVSTQRKYENHLALSDTYDKEDTTPCVEAMLVKRDIVNNCGEFAFSIFYDHKVSEMSMREIAAKYGTSTRQVLNNLAKIEEFLKDYRRM